MHEIDSDFVILSTRSMIDYAERVAYHVETFPEFRSTTSPRQFVNSLFVEQFADGEMEVEVKVSLRGKKVFLFANAARNTFDYSVEQNKLELYHTIDALRRSQASTIVLFEPYCSCSRSDRITRRNSVGFWVHYKTLRALGVDHIITYQLHSDKSKTVVDPAGCAIDDVPANQLIEEYITDRYIRPHHTDKKDICDSWIFCSVDAGGENLAKKYATDFGCPLMIAHKTRNYTRVNTVESIRILSDNPIENRVVWIVDDMIDTAGSVYKLAYELRKRGAAAINIATVHPVFSGSGIERLCRMHQERVLNELLVVDTIECSSLAETMPFLSVIPSARRSAEILMHIHEKKSLSLFFNSFNLTEYLSVPRLFPHQFPS